MNKNEFEQLSETQLSELVLDYKRPSSEIKLSEIIEKYNLNCKPNEIVKNLPSQEISCECVYCKEKMYMRFKNRTEMDYPYCKKCGHINYSREIDNSWRRKMCECSNCRAMEELIEKQKREQINKVYGVEHEKINFEELSFEDRYLLIDLIMNSGYSLCHINGEDIDNNEKKYDEIIHTFFSSGVLSVSPISSIDAFKKDEKFPNLFFTFKVVYDVNILWDGAVIDSINDNTYFKNNGTVSDKLKIFNRIMHEDVMHRFRILMYERGLDFEILVTAESEFKKLYEELSYGQVVNLCYQVAKFYLDKTKTVQVPRKVASKGALKTAVTFYNNSKNKGWIINNSEVSYAGKTLKDYIENVLGKDIRILEQIVNENTLT